MYIRCGAEKIHTWRLRRKTICHGSTTARNSLHIPNLKKSKTLTSAVPEVDLVVTPGPRTVFLGGTFDVSTFPKLTMPSLVMASTESKDAYSGGRESYPNVPVS